MYVLSQGTSKASLHIPGEFPGNSRGTGKFPRFRGNAFPKSVPVIQIINPIPPTVPGEWSVIHQSSIPRSLTRVLCQIKYYERSVKYALWAVRTCDLSIINVSTASKLIYRTFFGQNFKKSWYTILYQGNSEVYQGNSRGTGYNTGIPGKNCPGSSPGTGNEKGEFPGNSRVFGKSGNSPAKSREPVPGEYATKDTPR